MDSIKKLVTVDSTLKPICFKLYGKMDFLLQAVKLYGLS